MFTASIISESSIPINFIPFLFTDIEDGTVAVKRPYSGYNGELIASMHSTRKYPYRIKKGGTRIASSLR